MLILQNTTEVLLFSHELKTNEEMAGATFQEGKGSHLKVFLNGN